MIQIAQKAVKRKIISTMLNPSKSAIWHEVTEDRNQFIFDVSNTGPTIDAINKFKGNNAVDFYGRGY